MPPSKKPGKLEAVRRKAAGMISQPLAKALSRTGVSPDVLTWFGLVLAMGAAGMVATGYWLTGGILVLAGGLFDMLDGALARYTGRESRFGAVLDSTLDRASEGFILIGLAFALAKEASVTGVTLVAVVMLFSFLVSYIRSRAEAMQAECREGFFTRTERVIVLALGLMVDQIIIALAVIAAFSIITAVHRLVLVWTRTRTV